MTYKPPTTRSKASIDKAGRYVADMEGNYGIDPGGIDESLDIINSWRESHSYPLKIIAYTLKTRAHKVDKHALISQRLKRMSSVIRKLRRNQTHTMRLTSMNDMGGCRAVVSDIKSLNALVKKMVVAGKKNPNRSHELEDWYDYIAEPKADGYRGIHYIYKYQSQSETTKKWNGYRVEMQLRTQLQHAWATAVETYDVLSKEHLKFAHNDTHGNPKWKRFFTLAAGAFALREGTSHVPGTPTNEWDLVEELRELCDELDVWRFFGGVSVAVNEIESWKTKVNDVADQAILILDSKEWEVTVDPYTKDEADMAAAALLEIEKKNDPNILAVLVKVEDLDKLRTAYPNYYADTEMFMRALGEATIQREDDDSAD
jgi:ppGpp synthetase/RelA/SpoT-type nucleotidyltranferase